MTSIIDLQHQSVLAMQPIRGILKSSKSVDETRSGQSFQGCSMKRSESRSTKIPHFDEANLVVTHQQVATINEENKSSKNTDELGTETEASNGRLTKETSRGERHRKDHYNEFEIVRLHRHEIEAELRALEQDDEQSTGRKQGQSSHS